MKISARPSSSRSHGSGGPAGAGRGRHGAGDVEQAAAARQPAGEQRCGPRIEIRVAREAHVERLELPRGLEQQQRRVAAAVLGERDLGLEQIDAGSPELVERSGLRGRQQPASHVERPRPQAGLGGCERSVGSPRGIAGQRDRTLQERGRGREAAARLRPVRRELQLARDLLVGPGGRGGQVPRTTIRIDVPIRHLRQRQVGRPALRPAGRPVHGRARQGMAEGHALLERQQPVRRVDRGERDPEALAGALQEQRIADRLGRRDEQQASRVLGEGLEPPDVALLDPLREIAGLRHREPAGQLRRRQPAGQLEQRERVSPCLREDPVAHPPVQREPHRRAQQRAGVAVDEAAHLEVRHVPKLLAGLPCREHEPDRLGQQPASDERERQRRGPIQPLRVVDDAQQRTLLGHFGHQAEHGEADQEAIRRRPRGQAEDDPERVALRTRQPLEPIEQRRAQLMQAREGQLHLGLDAHRPRDGQVRRRLDQVLAAAPSSRSRPRPAGPATGSRPGGRRRSGRPAGRTRRPARGGSSAADPEPARVERNACRARDKPPRPPLPADGGSGQSSRDQAP